MILPITLNSPKFDFAIVGPTGKGDGVLICSENADTRMIGYANIIYTEASRYEAYNDTRHYERSNDFTYVWSDFFSFYFDKSKINVENRQFKVLAVWSSEFWSSRSKDGIQNVLNSVIFDLYKILFDESLTEGEKINSVRYLVSPLIYIGSK